MRLAEARFLPYVSVRKHEQETLENSRPWTKSSALRPLQTAKEEKKIQFVCQAQRRRRLTSTGLCCWPFHWLWGRVADHNFQGRYLYWACPSTRGRCPWGVQAGTRHWKGVCGPWQVSDNCGRARLRSERRLNSKGTVRALYKLHIYIVQYLYLHKQ